MLALSIGSTVGADERLVMRNVIYIFWTGSNEIPQVRKDSINSIKEKSGAEVVLVGESNIYEYIHPGKIHEAYPLLNLAHRADYLRCYFMHHFGGGYCDIKSISGSWTPYFDLLRQDHNLLGVGYKEANRHGVANICQSQAILDGCKAHTDVSAFLKWRLMQLRYRKLIGNGAFIFKPRSDITNLWWRELNHRLDFILPRLIKNPAQHPKERPNHVYDGIVSQYPVPWTWILGDILHPLSYKFRKKLLRVLPPPNFKDYQ